MSEKIIDEVMGLVETLHEESKHLGSLDQLYGSGVNEDEQNLCKSQIEAIRAKLRDVLERKPLSDTGVNLMAHNLDEGDWDSLVNRNCWLRGFQQGFREAEQHHQIGAE